MSTDFEEYERLVAAIDPRNCTCTSCVMGATVPLSEASDEQMTAMFAGKIKNCTNEQFEVRVMHTLMETGCFVATPRIEVRTDTLGLGMIEWSLDASKIDMSKWT